MPPPSVVLRAGYKYMYIAALQGKSIILISPLNISGSIWLPVSTQLKTNL